MKDEKITIRISEEEKEQLKMIAAKRDIPMSQLIREAVRKLIETNQEERVKYGYSSKLEDNNYQKRQAR